MTRQERREAARQQARRLASDVGRALEGTGPAVVIGGGVTATSTSHRERFEGVLRSLPRKQTGRHRWVAIACYTIKPEDARAAYDPEAATFLDHETLVSLSVGCYDCEQELTKVGAASTCPAGDEWGDDR